VDAVASIRRERVVAVLRRVPDVEAAVERLAMPVVEVTLDAEDAIGAIRSLRARDGLTVLAGTVRTADQARGAIEAGARAIVAPAADAEVAAVCHDRGVPWIPGALTPSEIEAAWRGGAALVKLFPARLGGPAYVRDVLAPLADVPLLVTGGVDAGNAVDFLRAGAVAVAADATRALEVYDAVRLAE
jgi:2-dehydro-3-deoxyphosphogluconate aldolase/(4S)-4-hydroxy-2-oxoglutarate aldolase